MFAVRVLAVAGALACGGALAQDAKPKTYKVHFDNTRWDDVFAWYAKETGTGYIPPKEKPKGALTLRTDPKKKFTLAEMTDLLNESLAAQGWIILRNDKWFRVLPADEKIDPTFVPKVKAEDVWKHGRTELVQTVLKVPAALEDEAKELWKFLTPFGSMVRLKGTVVVTDTAGNVALIKMILTEFERNVNIEGFKNGPPYHPHAGSLRGGFTRLRD